MQSNIDYPKQQQIKQMELLKAGFFGDAKGFGCWWDSKSKSWTNYPHILTHKDSLANLYAPIRQKALDYFKLLVSGKKLKI